MCTHTRSHTRTRTRTPRSLPSAPAHCSTRSAATALLAPPTVSHGLCGPTASFRLRHLGVGTPTPHLQGPRASPLPPRLTPDSAGPRDLQFRSLWQTHRLGLAGGPFPDTGPRGGFWAVLGRDTGQAGPKGQAMAGPARVQHGPRVRCWNAGMDIGGGCTSSPIRPPLAMCYPSSASPGESGERPAGARDV